MCKAAAPNVGGAGHHIISLGWGDVSPRGNVDRRNASPARVGGSRRESIPESIPERVKALLKAVNAQGEVCRVEVAKAVLQSLDSRCKH